MKRLIRLFSMLVLFLCATSVRANTRANTIVEVRLAEPTPFLFGCQVIDASGTYYDTLQTDSVVELHLSYCSEKNTDIKDSVERGQTYLFGCQTITPTEVGVTTWKDTLAQAGNLCDSIITLTLTAYIPCEEKTTTITDSTVVGETYMFGCYSITPIVAGDTILRDTLVQAGNSCDSIVKLTLKVWPAARVDSVQDTICQGSGYDWFINKEKTINIPAQAVVGEFKFSDTIKNVLSYDSIISVLTLKINPSYDVKDGDTICQGTEYMWADMTWSANSAAGEYVVVRNLGTVNNCDSIVTFTLTINPSYEKTDDDVVCQNELPYTWADMTWSANSAAGEYVVVRNLGTVNDCDSIVTFTLTINPSYEKTDGDVVCQNELPYTWADTTWSANNAAGEYVVVRNLGTVNDCDSIVTFTLTINPSYPNVEFNDTTCPAHPYVWEGDTYTTTGDYTDTLSTINGCDSIVTLHLLVAKPNADLYAEMDNLPASCKYNAWLLMVNRVIADTTYGLNPTENQVVWYRVNGAKDNLMDEPAMWDDEMLEDGYYYTADKSLDGQYYALINIPEEDTEDGCGAIYRTIELSKQAAGAPTMLVPNRVLPNGSMRLINLSEEATNIRVYDAIGQLMSEQTTAGEKEWQLRAASAAGVYTVQVQNTVQQQTLKFIVVK